MERSLTLIGALLAKAESTYATDPTPAAANDAIPCERGKVTLGFESEAIKRMILDGGRSNLAGDNALPRVSVTFTTELAGNGSVQDGATAIRLERLFNACDFADTATAESSGGAADGYITYNPYVDTTQGESVTIYVYSHKKKHIITGCKGTFKIIGEVGQYAKVEWTFMGIYNAVADATFPTGMAYGTSKPPIFQNSSSLVIGSYAPVLKSFTLDAGNSIQRRDSAIATQGVKGFIIGDRNPTLSLDPEADTEANFTFFADWIAGTVRTVVIPVGDTAGNKFLFTVVAQARNINYGERNSVNIHNMQCDIVKSAITDTNGAEFAIKTF